MNVLSRNIVMLLSFLWFLISHILQVFVSVAKHQPGGLLSWELSNGMLRLVLHGRWAMVQSENDEVGEGEAAPG